MARAHPSSDRTGWSAPAVLDARTRSRAPVVRGPTVGILMPGNTADLGNDAILDAVIGALRSRWARTSIRAYTTNPSETTNRHGIPAYRNHPSPPPRFDVIAPSPAARLAAWLARRTGLARLGTLRDWLVGETRHLRFIAGQMRSLDLLVVAGLEPLDEPGVRSGRWPYALFKWAMLARLTGTRLVVLSAALGPAGGRRLRFLLRTALRSASYRSFRDENSQRHALRLCGSTDPVVPDLVLGLSRTQGRIFPRNGQPLTVAVAPVEGQRRVMSDDDASTRQMFAAFVTRLLEQGHRVLLFATNAQDRRAAIELQRLLRPDTLARHGARLQLAAHENLEALLTDLSDADCVVACRLHAIVLGHALGLPVLALAADHAAAAHMGRLRQLQHCLELESVRTSDAVRAFTALSGQLTESAAAIFAASELARRAVVTQYERVLRDLSPIPSRHTADSTSMTVQQARRIVTKAG